MALHKQFMFLFPESKTFCIIDEKSRLIPLSGSQSYSVFRMNISSICRMTLIFECRKESWISNCSKLKQYNMHNVTIQENCSKNLAGSDYPSFSPILHTTYFLYLQFLLLGGSIASLRYSLVLSILYLYNRKNIL